MRCITNFLLFYDCDVVCYYRKGVNNVTQSVRHFFRRSTSCTFPSSSPTLCTCNKNQQNLTYYVQGLSVHVVHYVDTTCVLHIIVLTRWKVTRHAPFRKVYIQRTCYNSANVNLFKEREQLTTADCITLRHNCV